MRILNILLRHAYLLLAAAMASLSCAYFLNGDPVKGWAWMLLGFAYGVRHALRRRDPAFGNAPADIR